MKFTYKTNGVCSRQIDIEVDEDKIKDVKFVGGCDGNLKGICSLVKGMDVSDAIEKLEGINCRGKGTSCPDQLAQALKTIKE